MGRDASFVAGFGLAGGRGRGVSETTMKKAGDRRNRTLLPGEQANEDPFDLWLRRELSQLHQDMLDEPLPRELADLLEQYRQLLRSRHGANGSS